MQDEHDSPNSVDPVAQPAIPTSAEQLYLKIVAEIKRLRPQAAKLAISRLLNFIVPVVPAKKWIKCLDAPDPIAEMLLIAEVPWFLGRISRCLAEMNADAAGKLAVLNQMEWLRDIKVQENGVEFRLFEDFDELIALQLRAVLKQKASEQERFWRAFSDGFCRALMPRRQDMKAMPIYLFFAIKWETVSACSTMRELYQLVTKHLPQERCPQDVDPIDFEDRQFKWFEKLCQRSLGLSFKPRGRPALKAKYPQRL